MTTARVVLTGSLRLIRVIAEEETPSNAQLVDALESMNQMLHSLKSINADIGYQDITLDTDVPLPPEHIRPLRYMMAVELAPEYGTQVTPEVSVRAREAETVFQAYYGRVPMLKPDEGLQNRLTRYGYNIDRDV